MLQFAAKLEIPTIQSLTIILSRQIDHLTFSGSCHHEQSAKLILECSEKQQKCRQNPTILTRDKNNKTIQKFRNWIAEGRPLLEIERRRTLQRTTLRQTEWR